MCAARSLPEAGFTQKTHSSGFGALMYSRRQGAQRRWSAWLIGLKTLSAGTWARSRLRWTRIQRLGRLERSEPATVTEVAQHPHEHRHHGSDDPPEGADADIEREIHVHPEDARQERERQDHHAEGGEHAQDVVHAMRDHRLVGDLERLHDLLVVLEHVPDPLGGIDDVIEVDLQVLREVALLRALQVAQHRALRTDDLPEVDDLLLDVGDVPHDLLGATLEDVPLDP